ncbi:MAG: SipW-dependent-type signal peptide-containing protein [Schaedlerella sp.]|nr:SipW-dependent-type signal peptide-containing protein [Lachnospiraceae bacterium]MDY4202870.1 SipW-dependent-type signal peptide-containing protein [Schaedlerella sp.]
MNFKRIRLFILAAAIVGLVAAGGVSAYFTDADTAVNTFTVGKISLDLQEPGWNPAEAENLTPGKEITKDPQIKNDGDNPAFIFAEIAVPYQNLVTVNADGSKNAAKEIELFSYKLNDGWTELGTGKRNQTEKMITHLYVYGNSNKCKELAVGDTTPPVFGSVTFANVIEDQGLEGQIQSITVNAYGIQTTDIDGGKTAPEAVWSILSMQSPSLQVEADEDEVTDIKN